MHAMQDEVFTGNDIPWGLAFQFIHLHRLCAELVGQAIEGSALTQILDIRDPGEQLRSLSVLFSSFMPGEAHTEVQVPCTFPIFDGVKLTLPIDTAAAHLIPDDPEEQSAQFWAFVELFRGIDVDQQAVEGYLRDHPWLFSRCQLQETADQCFQKAGNIEATLTAFLRLAQLKAWEREFVLDKAIEVESERAAKRSSSDLSTLERLLSKCIALPGVNGAHMGPKIDHTLASAIWKIGNDKLLGAVNIYQALFHGHELLAKFFLEAGSRVFDLKTETAIFISAYGNNTLALQIASERGVCLEKSLMLDKAFVAYLEKGNQQAITLMQEMGYPIKEAFSRYRKKYPGCTPLHVVASKAASHLAQLLLDMGCNKEDRNTQGLSAMDMVPAGDEHEELRALLAPTSPYEPTKFERTERKVFSAVAIVRSIDNRVLMGRNQPRNGKPSRWRYPGGLLDEKDADIIQGAARETEEETGLPLAEMLKRGDVAAHVRHVHQSQWEGVQGHETHFIEFTGVDRTQCSVHPSDDFDAVVWASQSGKKNFKFPFVRSNWMLMNEAVGEGAVNAALDIEYYGVSHLRKAAHGGNLARVQELIGLGVPYEALESSPLQMAAYGNHREVVEFFYTLEGIGSLHHYGACTAALTHNEGTLFGDIFNKMVLPGGLYLALYDACCKIGARDEWRALITEAIIEHGCVDLCTIGSSEMGMAGKGHFERPVLLAIKHKDIVGLTKFLGAGAALNFVDEPRVIQAGEAYIVQEHPLMACIRVGFSEGVATLLAREGIDPNCTSGFARQRSLFAMSYFMPGMGEEGDIRARMAMEGEMQKLMSTYLANIPAIFLATINGDLDIVSLLAEDPRIDLSRQWLQPSMIGGGSETVRLEQLWTEPSRFSFLSPMFGCGRESISPEIVAYLKSKL